jgi:hypothetical protein
MLTSTCPLASALNKSKIPGILWSKTMYNSIHLLTGYEGNSTFIVSKVPTIFRGNAEEKSWYRGDNKSVTLLMCFFKLIHFHVCVFEEEINKKTRNPSEKGLQFRILNCTVVQYNKILLNRLDIRVIALLLSPLYQLFICPLWRPR